MISKADKKKLVQYLKRREGYLDYCDGSIVNWLEKEKESIRKNRGDTSGNQEAIFKLDYPIAGTFNNCMVFAGCAFLEDAVRKIGNLAIEEYDSKVKQQKSGSWLAKHFIVVTSHTKTDLSLIEEQIEQFEKIIIIRNAIAHAWGKVDAGRNPAKLREIIAGNPTWGGVTRDGYIHLEHEAYCAAMKAAKKIIDHMLNKMLTSD